MVKFKIKANPSGQFYFPKEVREELGEELDLICDAKAGVIFPAGHSLRTSLEKPRNNREGPGISLAIAKGNGGFCCG